MNSLLLGRCQTQITLALSDTLVGRSYGGMNRGRTWRSFADEVEPDIVIATLGAHVHADDATFMEVVDEVLGEMRELRRRRPGVRFAWKTHQPGGCTTEIRHPSDAARAAREMDYASMENSYNWDRFYARDLMLISRLREVGMHYLDMRMLYSRSDAHVSSRRDESRDGVDEIGYVDCLHMCSPGPLDVIGRLFHQLLVRLDGS